MGLGEVYSVWPDYMTGKRYLSFMHGGSRVASLAGFAHVRRALADMPAALSDKLLMEIDLNIRLVQN
ncbi:hypothetical protein N7451_012153 [Penicillium sp. IBT 35674x]|nr:hypothetical protein N7451_012153 [Penicillium sp. IBT 35674x]